MIGKREPTPIVMKPSQKIENVDEKVLIFERLYPEFYPDDLKIRISTSDIGRLILKGYRYCPRCKVMIKTTERICRRCGYAFRTRTTQSKSFGKVESIGLYPQSSLADRLKGDYDW